MFDTKTFAAAAALASLTLAATGLPAAAQSSLTNGPTGAQPNTLASHRTTGIVGVAPSRSIYRRRPVHQVYRPAPGVGAERRDADLSARYAYRRPLTVRRAVAAAEAPAVVAVPAAAGPGALVTGPLGFASNVVSLPFQVLNGIFPATGDVATNPLVIIGAPLHAVGDIVQVPLRIIGAPFGGTTIATY